MTVMLLMIYSIVELLCIKISHNILRNKMDETGIYIFNKGYKYNLDDLSVEKADELVKPMGGLMSVLLLLVNLIPGVNILSTIIYCNQVLSKYFKGLKNNNYVVPLSEEEKEEFSKLNKIQKLQYCVYASLKRDGLEYHGFEGNIIKLENKALIDLKYDNLPYLSYTLDEVKKLSNAINANYMVFDVEKRKIAVIGITDNGLYDMLRYPDGNSYEINPLTQETAENSHYIVYPYDFNYVDNENVKNCLDDIRKARLSNKKCLEPIPVETETRKENISLNKTLSKRLF